MDTDHRKLVHGHRPATGLRRLTPRMLGTIKSVEAYALTTKIQSGQVLAAFKAAAPHLGIGPRLVHAVDWLFRFTQAQDWRDGARPVVWPSAAMQAAELGVTPTHAKRLNRHLAELGLITMRDSPNGKRYGRRDKAGQILEAYGFDLSPLAVRLGEFQAVAEAWRAERAVVASLRRRASIARNSLRQTFETYREQGIDDPALPGLHKAADQAGRSARGLDALASLMPAVEALEAVASAARAALEMAVAPSSEASPSSSDTVDMYPKGHQNVPHQYIYKSDFDPLRDTVAALKKSSEASGRRPTTADQTERTASQGRGQDGGRARVDRGTCSTISPDEMVRLAPRLRAYLPNAAPRWPDIVEAADWLRHDLGVSKPLWGDACLTIGRERAAIALAIVSAKPAEHFRSGPAGYFYGMIAKAKAGELNLDRTIWALRKGGGTNAARIN